MDKYLIGEEAPQVPPYDAAGVSRELTTQVAQFLFPLLVKLNALMDKRLVRRGSSSSHTENNEKAEKE